MDGYIGLFSTDEAVVQTELDLVIEALIEGRVVVTSGVYPPSVVTSPITTTKLGYLTDVTSNIQAQLNAKEPTIAAGTSSQYWRGDKTWQTLNQAAIIGLTSTDSPTFAGITLQSDIVLTGGTGIIRSNTSDGADNKRVIITGGGAASNSRGAYINLHGNEYASDPGKIFIVAGLSSAGGVEINSHLVTITSSLELGGGKRPASWWGNNSSDLFHPYGQLASQGSYGLDISWNGYRRTTDSLWNLMNVGAQGYTTASSIRQNNTGILFYQDTGVADGFNPTLRWTFSHAGNISGNGTISSGAITSLGQIKSTVVSTTLGFSQNNGTVEYRWGVFSTDNSWRLEKVGAFYPITVGSSGNNIDFNASAYSFATGNVGIGTAPTTTKVIIAQTTGSTGDLLHLRDTVDAVDIVFYYDGGKHQIRSETGGSGYNYLTFGVDGKIGVANTNPTEVLDVTGNAKISGTISSGIITTTALADNSTNAAALFQSPSGRSVSIRPSLSTAAYNAIVQQYDQAIVASGGSVDTGVLVLTTWSNTAVGIRINNSTLSFSGAATFNSTIQGTSITATTLVNAPYYQLNGNKFAEYSGTEVIINPSATWQTLRLRTNNINAIVINSVQDVTLSAALNVAGKITSTYATANAPHIFRSGDHRVARFSSVDGGMMVGSNNASQALIYAGHKDDGTNVNTIATMINMMTSGTISFGAETGRTGGAAWTDPTTRFAIAPTGINTYVSVTFGGSLLPDATGNSRDIGSLSQSFRKLYIGHTSNQASGIVLNQTLADTPSPRQFFYNSTSWTGSGVAIYHSAANALSFTTNATPDNSSGTVRWHFNHERIYPATNDAYALGHTSNRWNNIYSVLGNFSGAVTVSGVLTLGDNVAFSANQKYISFKRGDGTTIYGIGYHTDDNFYVGAHPLLGEAAGTTLKIAAGSVMRLRINTEDQIDLTNGVFRPVTNNDVSFGNSTYRWSNVYSVLGNYSGDLTAATNIIMSGSTGRIYNNYTSGILGAGWDISRTANGTFLEIDNISVRNTLRTHIFQKDVVKVVNGYLYISDSGVVSGAASGQIKFKVSKSASFTSGMQLWIKDANENTGTVTSVKVTLTDNGTVSGDEETYTCTYNEGAYTDVQDGMIATRISGGTILFDASSAYSPFMDISDGTSVRLRAGSLRGKTSTNFGALQGYGFWSDRIYLEGDANIAGNLTVADGRFYAGLIKRNLTTYSENTTTTRWMANSWGGTQTFTFPSTTDPWGGTTSVTRATVDSGTVLYGQMLPYGNSQVPVGNKNVVYSISFWARANSNKTIILRTADAGWTNYVTISEAPYNYDTAVTTSWKRFTFNGFTWSQVATECRLLLSFGSLTVGDWVEVTGMQLEESSTASAYQRTDGTSAGSGYGMWSIAGGFGGTIQNPVVSLSSLGMSVASRGTTEANATEVPNTGVFVGDYKKSASYNSLILRTLSTNATSGLFYYYGTNEVFALRGDGTAQIAGWTVSSTTLANSTNIILDSSNKRISINSATWGADGIQLEYNAGNPRAYIGNGSNRFFNFDGTNISWEGANTSLTTAGLFTASNAVITGTITASAGAIAGWTIDADSIYKTVGTYYLSIGSAQQWASGWIGFQVGADSSNRIWFGAASGTGYEIEAVTGGNTIFQLGSVANKIAGWNFTTTALSSGGITLTSSATAANNTIVVGTATDYSTTGSGIFLGGDGKFRVGTSSNYLRFSATGIEIASSQFTLTSAGVATFSGALSAASGSFAGSLSAVTGTLGALTVNGTLTLGTGTIASTNFNVTSAGVVTMTGAMVSGTINASGGTFSNSVYVGATSSRIVIDGTNKLLKSENYVANTTGWAVKGDGTLDFRAGTIGGLTINATSLAYSNFSIRTGDVPSPESGKIIVDASGTIYISDTVWITKYAGSAAAGTIKISGLDDKIYVGSGIVIDGAGAGSITGGTIQTGASGQRIVISSTGSMIFYDSLSAEVGNIYGAGGTLNIWSNEALLIDNGLTFNESGNLLFTDSLSATIFSMTRSAGSILLTFAGDVTLYRSAANVLKTDDALVVGNGIQVLSSDANIGTITLATNDRGRLTSYNNGVKIQTWNGSTYIDHLILNGTGSKTTIAGEIYQDDIVKTTITEITSGYGNNTSRRFRFKAERFDAANPFTSTKRGMVHWWISTSSFGAPTVSGTQTLVTAVGTNFGSISTSNVNTAFSDSNGYVEITISNAHTLTAVNHYLHVEIQGVIYVSAAFALNTTGSGGA